ncbi:MAG: hypothetical protein U0793_24920 [Gemmataceae bacterium]
MDWTDFLTQAANLSLFELGQLSRAVSELCDNPDRILQARARLRPGMEVGYFDHRSRRMIHSRILRLNRTCALLEEVDSGERWSVHYHNIKTLEEAAPVLPAVSPKSEWRVGDLVSFKDRQNRDLIGRIEKLNPRTVSIIVKSGQRWRVGYAFLAPVHDVTAAREIILPPSSPGTQRVAYHVENLDEGYRHMAEDAAREREAVEWTEGTLPSGHRAVD